MQRISFERVREFWLAAGGKDTGGILSWFGPPVTKDDWMEGEVRADHVGALRFIGGDPGNPWEQMSRGTYKVGDAIARVDSKMNFTWQATWRLILIRDPESGHYTIIDGNSRAVQLVAGVERGQFSPELRIGVLVGELEPLIIRIAKTASSLWR